MSILIKGIEMPTSCWRCCLSQLYEKPREMLVCKITHEEVLWHKIDGNCPLVHVPKHGRLGDLDKISKVVLNWIATQEKAYPNEDSNALSWRLGARAMGRQIYRDIEAAPTIIEAEEGAP